MLYFDVEDEDHLAFLPKRQREHEDLAFLASTAEADVINHFTKSRYHECAVVLDCGLDTERYVFLRGYREDPAEAEGAFVQAMARCVANVIRWRIARDQKSANIESESGEKTSRTYRTDAEATFPPGFDDPLRPYRIVSAPYQL